MPVPKKGETRKEFVKRCIPIVIEDGTAKDDDQAVAVCNSLWEQEMEEQEPGGPDTCVCPDCEYETEKKRGVPCRSMECPECGAKLVAGDEQQEAAMPIMDIGQIAKSAIETALAIVRGSGEITQERAEKLLYALEADLAEIWTPGARIPIASIVSEATMKTVDGKKYPASDFLVVGDAEKPSTWHLQVKRNGKPDHGLMGGAKAALTAPGGHRGNQYKGPGKAGAISRLKALYKSEDMEWGESAQETETGSSIEAGEAIGGSLDDYISRIRDSFRAAFGVKQSDGYLDAPWVRDVFKDDADLGDSVIIRDRDGVLYATGYTEEDGIFTFDDRRQWEEVFLTYKKTGMMAQEMAEVDLTESASGTAIRLAEQDIKADPLKMHVAIIAPGFGNEKDNHYYPADMLRRDAGVFEGVKMYATDHREDEKSVRTEVSQILRCPVGFTEKGAPIAEVGVFDEAFAAGVRNREALGTLDSLHCSILARGNVKPGQVNGKKTNVVEAITSAQSVDWVTQAGAGGHALNLAESESGGDDMGTDGKPSVSTVAKETTNVTEGETEEVTLAEGEHEQSQVLAESEVERLISETNLPAAFKNALTAVTYESEDAVKSAIAEAITEVKKLTGSGKPFGQGGTASTGEPVSEKDVQERLDEVDRRYGLRE